MGLTISENRDKLIATQLLNGAYFMDAKNIFYLGEPNRNEPRPDIAFGIICCKEATGFYQKLVDNATAVWAKGQKPNLNSAGTSINTILGRRICSIILGLVKAHGPPDLYTCLPWYGKMLEGATGPISVG